MARATGDVLCWLNSDDYYLPDALKTVAQAAAENPDTDVFCGQSRRVDAHGKTLYERGAPGLSFDEMRQWKEYLPQPACFLHRRAWEKAGPLDEDLHYQMDYALWLRMAAAGCKFQPLDQVLACDREQPEAKTVHPRYAEQRSVERAIVLNRVGGEPALGDELAAVMGELETYRAVFNRVSRWPGYRLARRVWHRVFGSSSPNA